MSGGDVAFGVDNEECDLRSIFFGTAYTYQRVPKGATIRRRFIEPMAAEMVQRCGPCHSMEASNNWSCLFDADKGGGALA
jgi:hypothetical protein